MKRIVIGLLLILPIPCGIKADVPVVEVSGTKSTDTNWSADNIFHVAPDLTVNSGATLMIDPGVIVRFQRTGSTSIRVSMFVNGLLNAKGTADDPIIFTSERDDAHCGDTNKDAVATSPGSEDGGFLRIAGADSTIEHCHILYGGVNRSWGGSTRRYMLWVAGVCTGVDVRNCTFLYASSTALYYPYSGPSFESNLVIAGNDFSYANEGIRLEGNHLIQPKVSNNNKSKDPKSIEPGGDEIMIFFNPLKFPKLDEGGV